MLTDVTSKLLIVDDQPGIRMLLAELVRAEGYLTDCASSAEEALCKVEQTGYDLVLTDMRLPGICGIELTRKLVALRPEVKILLVTGELGADGKRHAIQAGVKQIILKPFDIHDIRSAVRAAFAASVPVRALQRS